MLVKTIFAAGTLAFGLAAPAQAVTFDIVGTFANGPFVGLSQSGTITYDETLLTNTGFESLAPVGSGQGTNDPTLAISFDIGTDVFTEINDVDFPEFPEFLFENGVLDFINYVLVDGENGVDLAQYGLQFAAFQNNLFFNQTLNQFEVGIETQLPALLPLPAGLPLMLGALGILGLARRRTA